MIVRSLRWRLVIATALIIAAVVAAAGVFSSVTVKREFNRFLIAQRLASHQEAVAIVRSANRATLPDALQRIHAKSGLRTIVFDERKVLIARWPPELAQYQVTLLADGGLRLVRQRGRAMEAIKLKGNAHRVPGIGTVFFLPSEEDRPGQGQSFRISVDRWLLGGLALAAVLAVIVMLTIFRRVFAPVEELTRGAQALASGRLDARVGVSGNDEIGHLASAFNAMAAALERNERARRNMVSDVAHELRTPLTNIRVQIEAVQDGVLEADAKLFASIGDDAATLARLVDDLQQLSLAEAGQLRLEVTEVNLGELVERALDGLEQRSEGLQIRRDVPANLVVRADSRRLVQVLRNLIVNALTYARSSIDVTAARSGDFIEIRVRDDGPGVPPEHAERIFERFHRADPSRSRTTGGAGLGLTIARELVELHGGTIRLEERSTFVVLLPLPATAGRGLG